MTAEKGGAENDPSSWRNWTPVSPYLAKDNRPDTLSQGMSLKMVELIEEKAADAQKLALEAEKLSAAAQKASQEALQAIDRKDSETVKEKCKEAEKYAAEAKEVEEKCKVLFFWSHDNQPPRRPPTRPARRRGKTHGMKPSPSRTE
mmetsp:Transcript_21160/g.68252  ORF Transcript_21160/g.68252 Transcript_21160/m.68252 type:complete len:146 (-) Transcript_21160:79-516(-)